MQIANGDRYNNAFAMLTDIADNRWRHVAGVVERLPPQPSEIYVDGVKQVQTQHNVPLVNLDVAAPLWLDRHHANRYVQRDNIYFGGEIDELSFYHRALTAREIQSIYRAGSRGKCRPFALTNPRVTSFSSGWRFSSIGEGSKTLSNVLERKTMLSGLNMLQPGTGTELITSAALCISINARSVSNSGGGRKQNAPFDVR